MLIKLISIKLNDYVTFISRTSALPTFSFCYMFHLAYERVFEMN